MTRKTFFESIKLFACLSALAVAASACAPAGTDLSRNAQTPVMEQTQGPMIDDTVEQQIAQNGEAKVHVRAIPTPGEASGIRQASDGLPPEIIALLNRLPEGSFRVTSGVHSQPEALGILNREGLEALRNDPSIEFVALDRVDDILN